MKKRKYFPGEVIHVYQRAVNGHNLFYSLEDRLVFLTAFYHFSRKWNVKVLGLCLMIDHLHVLLISDSRKTISSFVNAYSSIYAKLFNASCGLKGQLFAKSFGSAPKVGAKKTRTAISYLFNNPVEKNMCLKAEDYRWNLLAYGRSEHPFSSPIHKKTKNLSYAMREVRSYHERDQYLTYNVLRRILKKLDDTEVERLSDYIISLYNPIDYDALFKYYESYGSMLIAINSNVGSEYDIREEYNPYSDNIYEQMSALVKKKMNVVGKNLLSLSIDEKIKVAAFIKQHLNVTNRQLCKYLHLIIY
ncbi:MAG: transposase [Bacteroidales bacterium]|nr:transposase [Bacteroidales bacterium]